MKLRVRFEKTVTDWMDWLIVAEEEMADLLTKTGWKINKIIEPEDPKDSAYVAITGKE